MPFRRWPYAGLFAGLGLVSGVASALLGIARPLDGLQPIGSVFAMHPSLLPVGCAFAAAMAAGAWVAVRRGSAVVVVVLATLYGWSGAVHIAIRLQRNAGDDGHLLAAGLAAGAFGALLVAAAFALFLPGMRQLRAFAGVGAIGAVAGLLFYAGERGFIDGRALYIVWQAAVAAAIGLCLDRSARV